MYNNPRSPSSDRTENLSHSNRVISTYFREVGLRPIPTPTEERQLFTAYQQCKDEQQQIKYRKKIAEGYLRFVIKEALKKTKDEELLLDLIAAGNLGLMVAIDKFDITRGVKFLTYGAHWIRVHIQLAFAQTSSVRSAPRVRKVGASKTEPVSYTAQPTFPGLGLGADSHDSSQLDPSLLPSSEPSAEDLMGIKRFNALEEIAKADLTSRESLILIYYYGLRGGQRKTFAQLSQLLIDLEGTYVSSERVRQIKEKAIGTMQEALAESRLDLEADSK